MPQPQRNITITIPEELLERWDKAIERYSHLDGISKRAIIMRAIEDSIKRLEGEPA